VISNAWTFTTLVSFASAIGESPSGIAVDGYGNLFGTTRYGGATGWGTVFELVGSTHVLTTLATFNGTNGQFPFGKLALDAAGNIYAQLNPAVPAVWYRVHAGCGYARDDNARQFCWSQRGLAPGRLVVGPSGDLYGITSFGGANDKGTVFVISVATHALTTLASFDGTNGERPNAVIVGN